MYSVLVKQASEGNRNAGSEIPKGTFFFLNVKMTTLTGLESN